MWLFVHLLTSLVFVLSLHHYGAAQSTGAPQIALTHTGLKVANDGTVTLFCRVLPGEGVVPTPNIHWERNGRRLPRYRYYSITSHGPLKSVLRVQPVRHRRDDQAVFTCVASNALGQARASAPPLEVYPTSSEGLPEGFPRILQNPRLKAAERGRHVLFQCQATGSPQPEITWLMDEWPLDLTDTRLSLLENGFLQINNVQLSDEGRYECVAENSIGVVYSYPAMLYVKVRRLTPPTVEREENNSLLL